jgi:hypothetical protein
LKAQCRSSDAGRVDLALGVAGRRSDRFAENLIDRRSVHYDDAGAGCDALGEVGDVVIDHAKAAERDRLADRFRGIRAVDAGLVALEIDRACTERAAGAAGDRRRI